MKAILNRRKQQHGLLIINQNLVKQIIHLLKPFQSIMKMIQSGSSPTLYLVLPCTLSLRKALKSFENFLQHISQFDGEELNDDDVENYQEDEGKKIVKRVFLSM
jgi:hypothetical protein